jgi:uncharacterized membrane protein
MAAPAMLTHSKIAGGFALAEMGVDKLPFVPSRIEPFPLLARILSGAICGGLSYRYLNKRQTVGALWGVLGALIGSFGGFYLRRAAARKVPDPWVAVVEDGIVLSLGRTLLKWPLRRSG